MQLYDQILVRHGVMLVGPSGGGKSVSRNLLQKALTLIPSYMPDSIVKSKSIINVEYFV
jgi:dynein heavy chain